ncbi:MAG: threonine synthase [Gemmatimonadetes bacterium]|nr:threonine synthase [Gemmatimonadota bacterium]
MRYVSTAGKAPDTDLEAAILLGLAPDGGLYIPSRLDPMPPETFARLQGAPLRDSAFEVGRHLLRGAIADGSLRRLVAYALNFPIPVVPLGERIWVLELFHGPTLAFKDVGARFLAQLLLYYRASQLGRGGSTTVRIVVATSGDTGAAVAHAFAGLPHTQVFVLFPQGQISARQERLITTVGGNVHALAVRGTFDQCQRLVKQALADPRLRDEPGVLTGANSINVGRLIPQVFYYVHGWAQLPDVANPIVVAVPSGNFGNLSAGLMAKRLGLPVDRFIAATNANDVVPRYLQTGHFQAQPSVPTISNAMDVGDPSNMARIRHLYDDDVNQLRRDLSASAHDDNTTRECITRVYRKHGYILDPHTAVGYAALAAELERDPAAIGLLLSTAHPAKFAEIVEPLIGSEVPLPPALAAALQAEPHVTVIDPELDALRSAILSGGR